MPPTSNRTRRFLIIAFIAIIAALAIAFLYTKIHLALLFKRARYDQMRDFETAIAQYNATHTNLPGNLRDLVEARFLPATGTMYVCVLKYRKQIPSPIPYTESDYEIGIVGDGVMIRLKPSVLEDLRQNPHLQVLTSASLSNWVSSSERVLQAPDPMRKR